MTSLQWRGFSIYTKDGSLMSGCFSIYSGPDTGNRIFAKSSRAKLEGTVRCEMLESTKLALLGIIGDEYGISFWEGASINSVLQAISELRDGRFKAIESKILEKYQRKEIVDWMEQSLEEACSGDLELQTWRSIGKLIETASRECWSLVYQGD